MPGIEDITMAGSGKGSSMALLEEEPIISEKFVVQLDQLKFPAINSKILEQIEETGKIEENMSIVGRASGWVIFTVWNGNEESRQFKKVTIGNYSGYLARKSGNTVLECRAEITKRIKQLFVID
jgi:hypothetical protein